MYSANIVTTKNEDSKHVEIFMKRAELPIYSENSPVSQSIRNTDGERNKFVLQGVQVFRSEGCKLVRTIQSVYDRCSTFFRTGIAHASTNYVTTVDYLREERNILQRIGAVGGGVLLGNILGMRKSLFKRFLYTTSGGITAAAICYPEKTEDYSKQTLHLSKKYMTIGYHFLNGVSKDLIGYELPVFPLKTSNQEPQETVKKD